jgi:hypothetical protein
MQGDASDVMKTAVQTVEHECECVHRCECDALGRMRKPVSDVCEPACKCQTNACESKQVNIVGHGMNIGVQMQVSVDVRVLCAQAHAKIGDVARLSSE